jgi:hypothetical protein
MSKPIPQATVIVVTVEARQMLEAPAGSRKSEARMPDRVRNVPASGLGSRAVCPA